MKLFTKKKLSVLALSLILFPSVALAEDKATTPDSATPAAYGSTSESKGKTEKVEVKAPASVTGEQVEGTGTVTDFSTTGSQAFYTIKDNNQKIYYLVIDMNKTENNVHFLTDVDQTALAENAQSGTPTAQSTPVTPQSSEAENTKQETKKPAKNSDTTFYMIVGGLFVAGLLGYYFFVFRKNDPKKKEEDTVEDEEELDEDVLYDEE